ncbi:hypothetical protein HanIR_Chr08g0372161 [Helianthus annuus]|nr:hypothetical protein HanIR_Chr08g0372161 [Helianthus annuus]
MRGDNVNRKDGIAIEDERTDYWCGVRWFAVKGTLIYVVCICGPFGLSNDVYGPCGLTV